MSVTAVMHIDEIHVHEVGIMRANSCNEAKRSAAVAERRKEQMGVPTFF